MIPALAARTERIELGTLVAPVTFRRAAVLANASATANEITGGRASCSASIQPVPIPSARPKRDVEFDS